jgi:hypothetical protein
MRIFNNYFENMANYCIYGEWFAGGTKANWQIFNNVFNYSDPVLTAQPSQAIAIGAHNTGATFTNFHIFNNTFRGGNQAIAFGDRNGTILNTCHVVNNLFFTPGTGGLNLYGTNHAVVSNNASATSTCFLNSSSGNFRLTSLATTAISRAISSFVNTITRVDADGITRPQGAAWDIGAYEYCSTPVQPATTSTPTPTSASTPTATPASAPTPFPATAGAISPPFTTENDILSQPRETSISDGGRASYSFNITAPGDYIVVADVNAPSERANSFFVNIDAEPTGRTMIWDVLPTTAGIEARKVGWRGNGTSSSPEFPTKVFKLSEGTHTLIIRGLEADVGLSAITIAPNSTPPPSAPAAPQHFRLLSSR